ncbi:MAG: glycerol-3-phosphate 1-O-acyltransferase PlsY [Armatimonadetes bacterium]|nr:glycerol-3-phosphate 1-O-acyltransferase PlsY [Armatimonadota bacterium]
MGEAIILIASYLLGAVPFGLIIAKAWRGIDVRKVGSGNIGATNVYRTLGLAPGITVFIADVLKGFIPTLMAIRLFDQPWVAVAAGLSAIIGHSLSVFLKFKGGKGVATSLGVAIGLAPLIALMAFGIWMAIVLATRYVSVASIVAVLSVPPLMWAFGKPLEYKLFALLVAVFVIVKHRSNILRLIQGKELRFVKHNEKTEEQNG